MKERRHIPVFMTKDDLDALLAEIAARVKAGDSLEGHISWELPWWETDTAPADGFNGFRVRAVYRTGNLMGQGGMIMIGEWSDVPVHGLAECRTCRTPMTVIEECSDCKSPKLVRCPKCSPYDPKD